MTDFIGLGWGASERIHVLRLPTSRIASRNSKRAQIRAEQARNYLHHLSKADGSANNGIHRPEEVHARIHVLRPPTSRIASRNSKRAQIRAEQARINPHQLSKADGSADNGIHRPEEVHARIRVLRPPTSRIASRNSKRAQLRAEQVEKHSHYSTGAA